MKGIKKTICLLLSLIMILSMGVPAFAFDNATNEAQANTTTSEASPVSIEISTDKSSYSATGIAKITAKVTNTSGKDIKNVSAEAVFGELAPCKKNSSKTTAEAETLKDGESLEFTYSATINKNAKKLNIFEKIILWFVRLFNGGYSVKDNGFDNGRKFVESYNDIKFGKRWTRNTVKVWYGGITSLPTELGWYNDVDDDHVVITDKYGNGYIDNRLLCYFIGDYATDKAINFISDINGNLLGYSNTGVSLECQVELPESYSKAELEELALNFNKKYGVFCMIEYTMRNDYYVNEQSKLLQSVPNDPWKDDEYLYETKWNEDNPDELNWHLEATQVPSAWDYNQLYKNISIGVVDSGFNTSHEDLDITIINPTENQNEGANKNHGTHVAGIIGATANNNKGITGIVWNKTLYGVDVFQTSTQQRKNISVTGKYEGIKLALQRGCKIVNCSFGNLVDWNDINDIGKKAIFFILYCKYILKDSPLGNDFLIVQAAGNENEDSRRNGFFSSITPDALNALKNTADYRNVLSTELGYDVDKLQLNDILDNVIVVGAADKPVSGRYTMWENSNYGDNVSVVAPGVDILSTSSKSLLDDGYCEASGTSMAAPIVAGIAGLVWSVNANLSPKEVKDAVCKQTKYTVQGYGDDNRTYRMVNAKLAVESVLFGTAKGEVYNQSKISSEGSKPLEGTKITITGEKENKVIYADKDGKFDIKLPEGSYEFLFEYEDNNGKYVPYKSTVKIDVGKVNDLHTIYLSRKGGLVSGKVIDKETKKPISGLKVSFDIANNGEKVTYTSVKTSETGTFLTNLPLGAYSVSFDHDDYEWRGKSLSVDADEIDMGTIELERIEKDIVASGNCGAEGDGSNIKWELDSNGTLTISGEGEITSREPWDEYNQQIKTLIIENGVTNMYYSAFNMCRNLESIFIPESVTKIYAADNRTLRHYKRLTKINVSSSNTVYHSEKNCVIEIASKTLVLGCNTSVIPSTGCVTSIGPDAFKGCENLTSITIPNSVTSIGRAAFFGCDNLNNIIIPNSVTSIDDLAFGDCIKLTNITIPNSVTKIGWKTFSDCRNLTSITIPNSITNIDWGTFSGCTSLTSIIIPNSITNIDTGAFSGCTSLTNIAIPSSVTSIGGDAFSGCTNLTSITIPDSVTSIGTSAFENCKGLSSVFISNGVTSIGNSAFDNCNSLTNITIPNSITNIGAFAFNNCTKLTSLTIPNSVTSIGRDAFMSTAWYIAQPDGNVYAGKVYYKFKGTLAPNTIISIKDGTKGIAGGAFEDCTGLTSVTIPDSVTNIGDDAFLRCTGLKSITIPDGVKSIGVKTFRDCENLVKVNIPDSATSIGNYAFYNCGLTSITIPNNVTKIGYEAFFKCKKLSSITINNPICYIGDSDTISDTATIYGYKKSTAQMYAKKYNRAFIPLD